MSKKGSSYGTCGQRGKKACGARNGKVREGILSVLAYTLACESEKAHLQVSERERMCMRGVQRRKIQGEAAAHKQLL